MIKYDEMVNIICEKVGNASTVLILDGVTDDDQKLENVRAVIDTLTDKTVVYLPWLDCNINLVKRMRDEGLFEKVILIDENLVA